VVTISEVINSAAFQPTGGMPQMGGVSQIKLRKIMFGWISTEKNSKRKIPQ
jgi:hypothetical protein